MVIPVSHKRIIVKRCTNACVTLVIGTEDVKLRMGDSLELNRHVNVSLHDLIRVTMFGQIVHDDVGVEHYNGEIRPRTESKKSQHTKGGK
jgi:hypothetical protein